MENESELTTRNVLRRSTELSPQEAFQLLEKDDIVTTAVVWSIFRTGPHGPDRTGPKG